MLSGDRSLTPNLSSLTRCSGDRILTPWVKVMEGGSLQVPVLEVELRRAGDELLGVKAKVCAEGVGEEGP